MCILICCFVMWVNRMLCGQACLCLLVTSFNMPHGVLFHLVPRCCVGGCKEAGSVECTAGPLCLDKQDTSYPNCHDCVPRPVRLTLSPKSPEESTTVWGIMTTANITQ